ncbi:uncharacterized protein LOC5572296 isoform X1 [Aedes aegypti]|uniref:Uncharacterized protein n=1 Tax=Aedes aegypti TaxID=7159 RepID=A0A1S4EZP9_AEDAE|nr:uncharacterized protein LOC5572296 isoform X1 [Aedes aegypti]
MNVGDGEENPFIQALQSDALNELLNDKNKQEMAENLADNLRKLSDMFSKLSDQEKQQFTKEFKGQFINQLKGLSEMVKQQKLSEENSENMKSIPIFGANEVLHEELNFYLMIAFGLLILLFVVFFGYKLYLSLTEKERKLQEKQKAKQSKKKK